jgi:hypothetical protein
MALGLGTLQATRTSIIESGQSSITFTPIIQNDKDYIFSIFGAFCPSEKFELKTTQNANIIKYFGSDINQAQITGLSYEPIVLKGKLDAENMFRRNGRLQAESIDFHNFIGLKDFEYLTNFQTVQNNIVTQIVLFFKELKNVQASGKYYLMESTLYSPMGIQADVDGGSLCPLGYVNSKIKGLIIDISITNFNYDIFEYEITFQPLAPSEIENVENKKVSIVKGLKSLKNAMNLATDSFQNIAGAFDAVDQYYNDYFVNTLASLTNFCRTVTDLTARAANYAALPADVANQIYGACEKLLEGAYEVKNASLKIRSAYKSIKPNFEGLQPPKNEIQDEITDGNTAAAASDALLAAQLNYSAGYDAFKRSLNNNIIFINTDFNNSVSQEYFTDVKIINDCKSMDLQLRSAINLAVFESKKIINLIEQQRADWTEHVVSYGETLRSISVKYYNNVDKWTEIAKFNDFDGDDVEDGKLIKIPVI